MTRLKTHGRSLAHCTPQETQRKCFFWFQAKIYQGPMRAAVDPRMRTGRPMESRLKFQMLSVSQSVSFSSVAIYR